MKGDLSHYYVRWQAMFIYLKYTQPLDSLKKTVVKFE